MNPFLLSLIALPFVGSPIVYLVGRISIRKNSAGGLNFARILALFVLLVEMVLVAYCLKDVLTVGDVYVTIGSVDLAFDGIGFLISAVVLVLGACAMLFSFRYIRGEKGEEKKEYFHFGYRTSILKKTREIVLTVMLKLPPYKKEDDISSDVLKFRAQKQPKGKVAGSFFKNPSKEQPAGMLIDEAGLKGTRVGDIEISKLHGNWLMNLGKGTQKDLIQLAKSIKQEVKKRFNVDLEAENILIDQYGNSIDI